MKVDSFPLLMVLLFYLSAFITILIYKNEIAKKIAMCSSAVGVVLSFFVMMETVRNGSFIYNAGHFEAPWGIELYVGRIEGIISFALMCIYLLISWSSLYIIDAEVDESRVKLYYFLCNILIGSVMGAVFTNDIFNAFVFIEVGTLASCGIIVVKNQKENYLATLKYLILSSLGSGLFLMGASFIYSITGNLNLSYINAELSKVSGDYPTVILIATGLFTVGLGIKSAMFPLHTWLPDGHSSAPTSSSALLSAIVLKAFVLLYIKILYRGIGVDSMEIELVFEILLVLGSAGMIVGSLMAIAQKELKRMIAYSTVAQMGYIFFGIGLGTKSGLAFAIYHIIAHAFAKSILFITAGNMVKKAKSKYIEDLHGIGREMPLTMGVFTVASLSMVGIPILPGFVSKWNLALETIELGRYVLLAVVLVSGLLNALYYFPFIIGGYFRDKKSGELDYSRRLSLKERIPLYIMTAGMVYAGAASNEIIELFKAALG